MEGEHFKDQNQRFWGENAPGIHMLDASTSPSDFYDRVDRHRKQFEPSALKLISEIAEAGRKVLEVGCGLGTDSREFARRGMKAHSLDLSFSNVWHTKRGFETQGLPGSFVVADAERLPFKTNAFDLLYSFGVLHHTPDTAGAIQDLYRVTKFAGRFAVMLYHKGTAYYSILLYGLLSLKLGAGKRERLISKYYDHTPLSKMYSKPEVRLLFKRFDQVNLQVVNFGGLRDHLLLKWYWILLNRVPALMNRLGSYLIVTGRKPASKG